MKRLLVIFLLLAVGCTGGPALRDDSEWNNLRANALFDRAEQYYLSARYSQAMVDYTSYLDRYGDMHRANDCSFRIAQCLEGMGERMEAAEVYRATGAIYSRAGTAPAAFLRAGELFELEGWLREARADYQRASEFTQTEPGRTAAVRLAAVNERIAVDDAERAARRRTSGERATSEEDRAATLRPWPPTGRTLEDVVRRR